MREAAARYKMQLTSAREGTYQRITPCLACNQARQATQAMSGMGVITTKQTTWHDIIHRPRTDFASLPLAHRPLRQNKYGSYPWPTAEWVFRALLSSAACQQVQAKRRLSGSSPIEARLYLWLGRLIICSQHATFHRAAASAVPAAAANTSAECLGARHGAEPERGVHLAPDWRHHTLCLSAAHRSR